VATQSAAYPENHNSKMTGQHEQLVDRMNELVRHSQETNTQLTQNIKKIPMHCSSLKRSWLLKSIRWQAKQK
jgi:hypothetical protein